MRADHYLLSLLYFLFCTLYHRRGLVYLIFPFFLFFRRCQLAPVTASPAGGQLLLGLCPLTGNYGDLIGSEGSALFFFSLFPSLFLSPCLHFLLLLRSTADTNRMLSVCCTPASAYLYQNSVAHIPLLAASLAIVRAFLKTRKAELCGYKIRCGK